MFTTTRSSQRLHKKVRSIFFVRNFLFLPTKSSPSYQSISGKASISWTWVFSLKPQSKTFQGCRIIAEKHLDQVHHNLHLLARKIENLIRKNSLWPLHRMKKIQQPWEILKISLLKSKPLWQFDERNKLTKSK